MNKPQYGFTLIELLVVIVVIGILLTLASLQASRGRLVARDRERENDVKIISNLLENVYKTGQIDGGMIPVGDVSVTSSVPMGYPSTGLAASANLNDPQTKAILGAVDPKTLKSPSRTSLSLKEAASNVGMSGTTAGGVSLGATASNDLYVYQPLTETGALCTNANSLNANQLVIAPRLIDACVKYVIYYYSEASGSVQSIASANTNNNGL
jgi:prepilin-type N-terminal cleavage/methylation domain-containing protein